MRLRTVHPLVTHRRHRAAISLMEVLISVAVIAIGLLGVAVLLPVAGKAARDGATYDYSSRIGQNATREFRLRGYHQSQAWFSADNDVPSIVVQGINNPVTKTCDLIWGVQTFDAFVDDRDPGPMAPTSLNQRILADTGDMLLPNDPGYHGIDLGAATIKLSRFKKAFCIDPRFYAAQIASGNITVPNVWGNPATYFPYHPITAPDQPRLKRITLRTSGGNGPMTVEQATQIFMASDDIVFDVPVDPTQLPKQVFARTGTNLEINRQFDGRLSWFATLVPRNTAVVDEQFVYTLSIVVCRNRGLAMDGVSEQIATVATTGGGVGGGEMTLAAFAPTVNLEVRTGDWLMLGRYHDYGSAASPAFEPIFKWYRVTSTDGRTGVPSTDVTLQGPDWNFDPNLPTFAFLVKDVVGVYERSIRLETSSLWGY